MENRKVLEEQGKLLEEIDNLIVNRKIEFIDKISCAEKELILLLSGLIEYFNNKESNQYV